MTRVKFFRFGIPIPELQHKVFDSAGNLVGIADFYWELYRHLGEFDGKVKYLKYLRPGESPTDCVFREKRREDRMRGRVARDEPLRLGLDHASRRAANVMSETAVAGLDQSRRLYVQLPA